MANINITSDAWTEISITSGTVQNISATADIELSAEQTDNSGVVLKPSEIYQWDNETIYARAVTEDTGALRVVNFKKAAGGGGSYVLPVASATKLGGIKVGNNLTIDPDTGVLDATGGGGYVLPPATASTLGGVKIGSNISVDSDGVISTHAPYSLPTAAANTLGGIKVGGGLSIDASGVLSATGGGSTSYSTTEQVVGTWIDGKPLYQKTYSGTTPSTANTLSNIIVDSGLSTMGIGFIESGYIYNGSAFLGLTDDNHSDSATRVFISAEYNSLRGLVGNSLVSCPIVVTIRYTKTTD